MKTSSVGKQLSSGCCPWLKNVSCLKTPYSSPNTSTGRSLCLQIKRSTFDRKEKKLAFRSLRSCNTLNLCFSKVNKLAVSEAERKDQEESKQDQPIVFGMSMFLRCDFCVLESVVFAVNLTFELLVGSAHCNTQ